MIKADTLIVKALIVALLLPCFAVFGLLACADFPDFCMRYLIGW